MNQIKKLLPIFIDVFDDDTLIINELTNSQDISGWDSLAHIRLFSAIEKYFGMHFSASEIVGVQNVGDIVDLILAKQQQNS
jgi:acyl carrier protein